MNTSDAILEFTNKFTNKFNDKLYTIAVFFDLSKTFDTCNKDIMVKKLRKLGFRGVVADWFESYMTDRRMIVDIAGKISEAKTVNIGL